GLSDARICRQISAAVADGARKRLEEELVRRHEPLVSSEEPLSDWDSALQKLAPALSATPQQNDLGTRQAVEAAVNKNVYVNGTLTRLDGNIGVVEAGSQQVFIFIGGNPPFRLPAPGEKVEVGGTVTGSQAVGDVGGPV